MNNNGENDSTIICSRCGAEMKASARYCMKCGNLNPNHPDNRAMLKYMPNIQSYYVQSNGKIDYLNNNSSEEKVANNGGSNTICFFVNYLIYVFLIILSFVFASKIFYTPQALFLLISSIVFLYIYSLEKMYMKMNKKWWLVLIPFYNFYVLSDAVLGSGLLSLLLLIPVVGSIFNVILIYNLGKKFGKNGFLTVIFTFILIPIIGLGESSFEGLKITIDDASLERNYKYKRIFFYTILIVGIFSLGLIIYNNLGNNFNKFKVTDNYPYIGNDMRKKLINDIDSSNNIYCNGKF